MPALQTALGPLNERFNPAPHEAIRAIIRSDLLRDTARVPRAS